MYRASCLTAAVFLFVCAQAVQRSVDGPAVPAASKQDKGRPSWLKGLEIVGEGAKCSMEEECIVGSGAGICCVKVVAGVEAVPLTSTDSGYNVTFSGSARFGLELRMKEYSNAAQLFSTEQHITVQGHSKQSHWNLCWRSHGASSWESWARRSHAAAVEDYCYYVNGLCFLWASPCSGGCSQLGALTGPLANPAYATFCPAGLRYATANEWTAAVPTLIANKAAFHDKCAAGPIDPSQSHCDMANNFVRVPNGGYDEQVLVCGDVQLTSSPTPSPTSPPAGSGGGGVHAIGDPHLQNVHGQKFDLMKPGTHVLVNIPKGELEHQLLRVQADVRRLGGCKDMYFQEINITGSWAETKQAGGYRHIIKHRAAETPAWVAFGTVELKVVHGHTKAGLEYLNFYVKHLGRAGVTVGGLLGDDDHTAASTPSGSCARRGVALLESDRHDLSPAMSSIAEASFE